MTSVPAAGPGGHLLLTGGRIVTADADVDDGWVEIAGSRIVAVGSGTVPARADAVRVELDGLLLTPGFVDVHQHGGGGASYDDGPDAAAHAVAFHRRHGTTTSVASLVSAPLDALETQVAALAPLVEAGVLAGIHLEGPWLSPRRAGAHDPTALREPSTPDVARLLAAGRGAVRMVTLAPELPGGPAAVDELVAAGVVVAVGHTDATHAEVAAALHRGASGATHLFNAMRPLHHREPGPVLALLESAAVVELVADGRHLHPAVLAAAARALGPERTVLVSDAIAAAGMADGSYRLGGHEVTVTGGAATGPDGEIAGGTGTLADALRFAVTVAGLPVQAAVAAVSSTPARMLGLTGAGRLVPGATADVVLMTPDLRLAGVLAGGGWARPLTDPGAVPA